MFPIISLHKEKTDYKTYYFDPETECEYDNLEELIQYHVVGHCGCGLPKENVKLIYDMLMILGKI